MAGRTPALTHGAANLAGPWNVTQACFCGLAPLPGEGAKRPLARPAGSCDLGVGQIWLPLSSNGSSIEVGTETGPGHHDGFEDSMGGRVRGTSKYMGT